MSTDILSENSVTWACCEPRYGFLLEFDSLEFDVFWTVDYRRNGGNSQENAHPD